MTKNVVEGEDWAHLDEKLAPLAAAEPTTPRPPRRPRRRRRRRCRRRAATRSASISARAARRERAWIAWLRGEAALAKKDVAGALAAADTIAAAITAAGKRRDWHDCWRAAELQLRGRAAILRGAPQTGLKLIGQAADLEDRETPSGPVESGVSSRERLGEACSPPGARATRCASSAARSSCIRGARACSSAARAPRPPRMTPRPPATGPSSAQVWEHADADMPGVDELHHALAAR